MSAVVKPTSQQLVDLAALLALASYTGAKIHLYTANLVPDENTTLADLVASECTFVGYSAKTWTPSAPYVDPNGNVVAGGAVTFIATTGLPNETIYGAYLTDTAAATLLGAWALDAPVGIANPGDGVTLTLLLGLDTGVATQGP